jgi:uncharacterized membrane protein YoaK (UPF0700 family)
VTDLRWQQHREFLVGLTAAAGWLDALAFLHLGKVFISFASANLLFVGIGVDRADAGLVLRAGAALLTFVAATAVGVRSPLRRTLLLESGLLAAFAVLWVVTGGPAHDLTLTLVLLVLGAAAMGLQASIAFAFHLPNVAKVIATSALARLGALVGRRRRARRTPTSAGRTPGVSLLILLCLAYVISAVVVAAVPQTPAMAFGPVLLLASAVVDGRPHVATG